ncbi:hypothetical protein [Streptomyces sp. NPDC058657]|uniref:hypothetical protein n=1 Tax=unclassified Streptomyces TaxID=2593676 RepID=UPI0036620BAA
MRTDLQVLLPQLENALQPTEPQPSLRLRYAWGFPRRRGRQAQAMLEERHHALVHIGRRDDRTAGVRDDRTAGLRDGCVRGTARRVRPRDRATGPSTRRCSG